MPWPKPIGNCEVKISVEYAKKDERVWYWINNYANRNKIPKQTTREIDQFRIGSPTFNEFLILGFRSVKQMNVFQRLGNREFPAFEFL